MNLSLADIAYINTRIDEHELKYQEVYDEIKDHVMRAMEVNRANGDERNIECLYNDMMENQFPGYYPFERIAISYEKAYRIKIKKTVWANFRHYLSPLNVVVLLLVLFAGYNLPETKVTYMVIIVILLIASAVPVIYVRLKSAKIKTDDRKRSIVKKHISQAAFLYINFYIVMVGLNLFDRNWNLKSFNTGSHNPTVNLFIIAFAVIYGLSIARLCRQEINSPMLNINE